MYGVIIDIEKCDFLILYDKVEGLYFYIFIVLWDLVNGSTPKLYNIK